MSQSKGNPPAVLLREVRAEDLPVLFEYQRDEIANQMADFPARDHDAFTAHWAKILADEANVTRVILCDGQVAGSISSFLMLGHREVGYWIGRAFWGRGVGTQALAAFLQVEQRRPLAAHVVSHNLGSLRVLEKCGFKVVKRAPEASLLDGSELEAVDLLLE